MQTSTLEFPHNARTTYSAIKHLFEKIRAEGEIRDRDRRSLD